MTPNEQISASGLRVSTGGGLTAAKAASTICLLAGIWLFISPWVYRASANGNAWNCWIVGGFMILFGIIRIARPAYSTVLSWCNMVLGIWTFFSPWIYGYTSNTGRFINSLCVGVVVFVFSIAAARISAKSRVTP
jgi:SPW repeat